MARHPQHGVTRTAVLLLVIVAAFLTAAICPRYFFSAVGDKDCDLRFNLHLLRARIEMCKDGHGGRAPALAKLSEQLAQPADAVGRATGLGACSGLIPANPFNGSNAVTPVAIPGKTPAAPVPGGAGWQYDESTGGFYPNNPEYYGLAR
jgi:hypothetical protein